MDGLSGVWCECDRMITRAPAPYNAANNKPVAIATPTGAMNEALEFEKSEKLLFRVTRHFI